MKFELLRKNVKWAGITFCLHIGAMIIFSIFVSSGLAKLEENELIAVAHGNALLTSIIVFIIFSVFYFKIASSFTEYQRTVKEAMKEESFSVLSCYKKSFLREDIWKMGILSAFQLPFMAFFAMAGVSYLYSTVLDRFYILEAGFYGVLGSSVLGWLVSTLVFSLIFFACRFIFLAFTVRSIKNF